LIWTSRRGQVIKRRTRHLIQPLNETPFMRRRSRIASGFKSSGVIMEYLQTQGISLPRLGLGTFRMQGEVCRAAVESALGLGYRHIDTAEMYGNEDAVGAAIAASGVARKDLHVTTKVWNENLAPDAMRKAFDTSLDKLKLDHVDLYLVHWPKSGMNLPAMFETLMKLKQEAAPVPSASPISTSRC
jgi:aryl-alcohol dehydrogenase-like predicted oxidoreductase